MGILRPLPLLRKHCGHVVRPLRPEGLKGRRVWVDVHGPLFCCAYRSPGNSQSITRNFLALSERLEAFGMQPIFVSDSAPKPAKVEHILIERARKRDVQQARRCKDLEDLRSIRGQLEELGAGVPHNLMQRRYSKRCLASYFARRAILDGEGCFTTAWFRGDLGQVRRCRGGGPAPRTSWPPRTWTPSCTGRHRCCAFLTAWRPTGSSIRKTSGLRP
ncbi:unnamed protein product [Polarella glacialis]|uniref:Uncharacterized protein n=1 Tax=Polarella glacialis TaxID=89957 RepID=A0A813L6V1_POLGL|nr:unnamed protein product [Polarella glacialis]